MSIRIKQIKSTMTIEKNGSLISLERAKVKRKWLDSFLQFWRVFGIKQTITMIWVYCGKCCIFNLARNQRNRRFISKYRLKSFAAAAAAVFSPHRRNS